MLKIAYSPIYKYQLPNGHRFPMEKYELIPEQLLYEGTISDGNFFHPESATEETILLTHDSAYWEKLKNPAILSQGNSQNWLSDDRTIGHQRHAHRQWYLAVCFVCSRTWHCHEYRGRKRTTLLPITEKVFVFLTTLPLQLTTC